MGGWEKVRCVTSAGVGESFEESRDCIVKGDWPNANKLASQQIEKANQKTTTIGDNLCLSSM